jgi:hypothetical protein
LVLVFHKGEYTAVEATHIQHQRASRETRLIGQSSLTKDPAAPKRRQNRQYWFANLLRLPLIPFLTACLYGTTVLSIRTPQILVVGADSDLRRGNGISLEPICKIRRYGHLYASFSGISTDEDTHFDIFKIAAGAISKCLTIERAPTNFKHDVTAPLINTLAVTRR